MSNRMKLNKKQQRIALSAGIAAVVTMGLLIASPLGNFMMSNLFGTTYQGNDAGLYQSYNRTVGTGSYMRVGTGAHLGSNNTYYGTGSTVKLRAQLSVVPRSLDVNSVSGVISYNPEELSFSNTSLLLSGSGYTIDGDVTRVVKDSANRETGELYFSIDKKNGNFFKPAQNFISIEVEPKQRLSSYQMTLQNLRFLNTRDLVTGTSDSLYLDGSITQVQKVPLVITPGSRYIIETVTTDAEGNRVVTEHLYRADDTLAAVTVRVYDAEDGNLIRESITEYGPDGTTVVREIEREYYPDGVTVRTETETIYNPDGTITIIDRTYDPDGNLIDENIRSSGNSNANTSNGNTNTRPPTGGGGGGGGGGPAPTPTAPTGGGGGGFSETDQEFFLPGSDDGRSMIVYGPLNFKNANGVVHIPIRHIDKPTGMEAAYTKGTTVKNADGSNFTGIYMPMIRYPLADLRQPMRGLLPTELTQAYEYFMQYGNLNEVFGTPVTIKATLGDLGVASKDLVVIGWDFQQQKWVEIGNGSNIIDGKLTVGINKSMIIAVYKRVEVTQANTGVDICDDVTNRNRTPFRDANNHWATSFICKLYNLKAITGYTDGPWAGLFRPDNSITRGELLKIIMAAEGYGVNTAMVNSGFPDVPTYEWFAPYVTEAKRLGIIDGYPDGTFQPFRPINRSEALKIILNASKKVNKNELNSLVNTYKTNPPARSSFNDINTVDWFAPFIDLAASKGIISGKQPGIFRAGDNITRAEVSKVVQLTISLE